MNEAIDPVDILHSGDPDAVGRLLDACWDEAFAFAARVTGEPHEAADAVQDAYLRILRYREAFDGRGSFRGWLFTVVRNACRDRLAARRRERNRLRELPPEEPATAEPSLPDPRLDRLRRALDELSVERREALVLRRFHDLPYAEIGDVLDISEGAARVRVHRAMTELKTRMTDAGGPGNEEDDR